MRADLCAWHILMQGIISPQGLDFSAQQLQKKHCSVSGIHTCPANLETTHIFACQLLQIGHAAYCSRWSSLATASAIRSSQDLLLVDAILAVA